MLTFINFNGFKLFTVLDFNSFYGGVCFILFIKHFFTSFKKSVSCLGCYFLVDKQDLYMKIDHINNARNTLTIFFLPWIWHCVPCRTPLRGPNALSLWACLLCVYVTAACFMLSFAEQGRREPIQQSCQPLACNLWSRVVPTSVASLPANPNRMPY